MAEPGTVEEVRRLAASLQQNSGALRAAGPQRVARAIRGALDLLSDERGKLGSQLRQALLESTGLSAPVVEWGLRACFEAADESALLRVAATAGSSAGRLCVPARLAVSVLSGNLFAAELRAIALPLLAGAPTLARASSRDGVLARFLEQALDTVDPEVGASLGVVTFDRNQQPLLQALFESAEVVSVYGDDRTVLSVREQIPAGCRLVAHGHGLGAVYLPAAALPDEPDAVEVARQAAIDVAAYDQRGCLSPHFICVQGGGGVDAAAFARLLAEEGLTPLSSSFPRGRLADAAAADQMQWRGVAEARGTLFKGPDFAVSYEAQCLLRLSPGYRNVGVYNCAGSSELVARLLPFGLHLKALGVAGGAEQRALVAHALPAPLAPNISRLGEMQKPAFAEPDDGQPALTGLVRWIDHT